MKLLKFIICTTLPILISACGTSNRHEEIKKLVDKENWDQEQTQSAINYYIEGVDEACNVLENMYIVNEKVSLKSAINRFGDEDVVKDRRKEIAKAEKAVEKKQKEIARNFKKDSSGDNDYEYDSEEEDYDY